MTIQATSDSEYHEFVKWLADDPQVGDTIVYKDGGHGYVEAEITIVTDLGIAALPFGALLAKTWGRDEWRKAVWNLGSILPRACTPPFPDLTDTEVARLISLVSRARDRELIHIYRADNAMPIPVCAFCLHELDDERKGHTARCEGEVLRHLSAKLSIWSQERWGDNRRNDEKRKKGK